MAVSLLTQKWSAELHKELFEVQDYTRFSKNYQTMENVNKFTIPQSGSITAGVDDYVRPLTPGTRTDTGVEVELVGTKINPFYIELNEQYELSYDKRAAITEGMRDSLNDFAKQKIVWGWLNTSDLTNNVVFTTGASGAGKPTGATGNRKKIALADIQDATLKLDEQNVPRDGRKMMISPAMFKDIKNLTNFQYSDQISTELLTRGVVGMIDGVEVMVANAPDVLVDASGGTAALATYGATGETYSYWAAIFHPSMVARVVGMTKVWVDEGSATYTSDVMSATQRIAGALGREDQKGFVTLVQTIA